jgi:hypothetical protein
MLAQVTEGVERCAHAQPEVGVPAVFSGVLTGNDVTHRGFLRVRTYATGS